MSANSEKEIIADFTEEEIKHVYYCVAQRFCDIKVGRYDSESIETRTQWAKELLEILGKIERMGVIL